jgi:hypothetical protein
MLISTSAAAITLSEVGLSRERTRLLLETGVAGPATRVSGAVLYDAGRVEGLTRWLRVRDLDVAAACPDGLLVGRLAPHRRLDLTDTPDAQRRAIGEGWHPPRAARWLIHGRAALGVTMPFVATVSGFILLGADVAGIEPDGRGGRRLLLEEPGEWYDELRGRRWLAGRGGPALLLWGWPPGPLQASSRRSSIASSASRA